MDERGDGGAGNEEGEEGEQWGEEDGEWEEEANGDNEEWILCDECQMGPPSSGESRLGPRPASGAPPDGPEGGGKDAAADAPAPQPHQQQFQQNVARFRLYRHRSLQENTRFEAFKIYQITI